VNKLSSKSRQPNHIISSGGIIGSKLASNTVDSMSKFEFSKYFV